MPSFRSIAMTVGVTLLTMYALNMAAAYSPMARKLLRGVSVSVVPTSNGAEYI